MRVFVFLALVCYAAAQQCGRSYYAPKQYVDRIIGGTEANPGSWPWMVSLQDNGFPFCGGTLINREWVLSAAHCRINARRLIVIAGDHNLATNEGTEQAIRAERVIAHPDYNPHTLDNDIMLIKLSTPATINSRVSPACLPGQGQHVSDGTRVTITGWGNTLTSGSNYPNELYQVTVPTIATSTCNAADSYAGEVTNNMFCAGFMNGGKDSCQGDSGGPVVNSGTVYGVVSWGYGCAQEGYPGVYVKVANYVNWINGYVSGQSTFGNGNGRP
ncbi:trypsin-3-like [Branchiostoma floridae]|uniref:Trypsin-3-like n=1 Tax=Branchiostoma floridae TaxID=7739 RepID=A0A9J7MGU6_BRAFL|nr:trypsin-3-like [Branchiostoma floridae]